MLPHPTPYNRVSISQSRYFSFQGWRARHVTCDSANVSISQSRYFSFQVNCTTRTPIPISVSISQSRYFSFQVILRWILVKARLLPLVSISQSRYFSFQGAMAAGRHGCTQAVSISQSRYFSFQVEQREQEEDDARKFQSRNRDTSLFRRRVPSASLR